MYISGLHSLEHGPHLALPQTSRRARDPLVPAIRQTRRHGTIHAPAAHVDYHDESGARVGLEAVSGEAVVDGVEEAKVTCETDARGGILAGAELKDVEGARENEGELEGCAHGTERVGRGVVGGEDRRV